MGMILEGDTGEESLHQSEPPAPSMARAKVSNGTPKNQEQPSMEQTTGKSRFASVRRNIFDEQLDPSKVQVGKQEYVALLGCFKYCWRISHLPQDLQNN